MLGVEESDLDAGIDESGGEMEHGVDVSLPWSWEHENVHRGIHHSGERQIAQLADLMAAQAGVAQSSIGLMKEEETIGNKNTPN